MNPIFTIFKISFLGADSFFIGCTKKNVNFHINQLLYRQYIAKEFDGKSNPKYKKLYDFIENVGIDNMIVETLFQQDYHPKNELKEFLNQNPPLN